MPGSIKGLVSVEVTAICMLVVAACATTPGSVHGSPSASSASKTMPKIASQEDRTSMSYAMVAVLLPADVSATSVYVSERGARARLGQDAWVRLYLQSGRLWAGDIPVVGEESSFVASFRVDGAAVSDTLWVDSRVVTRGQAIVLDKLISWDQRDIDHWQWVDHLIQFDLGPHLRKDLRLLRVTIEAPEYQIGSNFATEAVALGSGIWVSSVASWVTPESRDALALETIRVFANLVYASSDGERETVEESTPLFDARVVATSWHLERK